MIDKNMLMIGGAVLAAVVVLVALIVLVVLVRRYLAFRRRMAEMTNMKKDLMAWQNLNGLVRGGNKGREAKAILSSKLGEVRISSRADFVSSVIPQVPWRIVRGSCSSANLRAVRLRSSRVQVSKSVRG